MENKFTPEQIAKAKQCKTVEELISLAKENGIDLTEAEATNIFAQLNPTNGDLADAELDMVAGGVIPPADGVNISWPHTEDICG